MVETTGLLLPEGARLLHIGPYKTGSTATQAALHAAREEMRGHGVVYPGKRMRDRRAGWAVLDMLPRGLKAPSVEHWYALVREVESAADQRVCVSNEDFGRAGLDQAARIVEDLGGDRVHVVAGARCLDRLLPSAWQQRVKGGLTLAYEDFLRLVLDDPSATHPVCKSFWGSYDISAMVGRWVPAVGRERFTLIVVDESDRGMLLRTIEQLLGLSEGLLDPGSALNLSLSMNGTELLRRVNELFAENDWSDVTYHQMIRTGLLQGILQAPTSAHDTPILPLPQWAAARVAELSAQRVESIKSLGIRVVGDPDGLYAAASATDRLPTTPPPETISIEWSARAVAGVVREALELEAKTRRRHERQIRQARRPTRRTPGKAAKGSKPLEVTDASTRELVGVLSQRALRTVRGRRQRA